MQSKELTNLADDVPEGPLEDPQAQHEYAITQVPEKKLTPDEPEGKDPGKSDDFVRYIGPGILALCVVAFVVLSPGLAFIALLCLLMFGPCVVLHELAHLFTAKRAGMQVTEFSIGFGRRIWSRQWKDITWSLKILPLGGAVEIAGMTVEDVERNQVAPERAFIYKRPRSRMWVALSGILTNVVLAWAALSAAVLLVAPEHDTSLWFYLGAGVEGFYLLSTLLTLATEGLGNALVNWNDPDVGSILALPQGFATGASQAVNEGIPLVAYFVLFFGALNISLAVFNALPLYPLDGYHGATALVDQVRRVVARIKHAQFAPLSTWRLRWFSRGTGTALGMFVGSLFLRDIIRLM